MEQINTEEMGNTQFYTGFVNSLVAIHSQRLIIQGHYNRGVLIYRIGKISVADMAKFSISAIGNCTDFLLIFYTSTNWLILLMHCLVVTIFYCVDNHFTSFVAILLLLTMVYNEFYYIICAIHRKNSLLCILDRLSLLAFF